MKQSTKRYIFLFCWWLGLVVIWTGVLELSPLGYPNGTFTDAFYLTFQPSIIFLSLVLWWSLHKYFPGHRNWGWAVAMPFLINLGVWLVDIFIIGGLVALLGG